MAGRVFADRVLVLFLEVCFLGRPRFACLFDGPVLRVRVAFFLVGFFPPAFPTVFFPAVFLRAGRGLLPPFFREVLRRGVFFLLACFFLAIASADSEEANLVALLHQPHPRVQLEW